MQFDLNQLSEDVSAAYEAYTTDTLDGIWAYKSEIMQKIIEADGGNWYNKRRGLDAHGRKRARSGESVGATSMAISRERLRVV